MLITKIISALSLIISIGTVIFMVKSVHDVKNKVSGLADSVKEKITSVVNSAGESLSELTEGLS